MALPSEPWWAPPWRSSVLRELRAPSLPALGAQLQHQPRGTQPWLCKWSCCHSRAWRACSWKCKYGRLGIAVRGGTLATSAHRQMNPFCSWHQTQDAALFTEALWTRTWEQRDVCFNAQVMCTQSLEKAKQESLEYPYDKVFSMRMINWFGYQTENQ